MLGFQQEPPGHRTLLFLEEHRREPANSSVQCRSTWGAVFAHPGRLVCLDGVRGVTANIRTSRAGCACVCALCCLSLGKSVTMNVCVSGMECVCAPRWCANVHLGCSVRTSEGEGDGPQASVSLCVSLGVSQSGSGCGDRVLAGVCIGWGTGECRRPGAPSRVGVSACGGCGLPVAAPPQRLGLRCPDSLGPAPSHSHPLSHKDFSL